MNTVKLIVTGEMEKKALANALNKVFPTISFETKFDDEFAGFTSSNVLQAPTSSGFQRNIDKFASELVAAVDPGRRGIPADMAIAIDDLELENINHEKAVAECFREAVIRCVENRWPSRKRQGVCFQKVRERCSFHLFVPMTEAYFFGETNALKRAGAERNSMVSGKGMDVENFRVTNDPDYLNAVKGEFYWAIDPNKRNRHPKHYLQYLCDPEGSKARKTCYRETKGGVRALQTLDWNSVLKNSQYVMFLRSLFEDISDKFGLKNSYPGECSPITRFGKDSVLRNI